MTFGETKEFLRESVVAVILGNGISSHRLAFSLSARYGVCSILCGERKNLLDAIDLRCGFLRMGLRECERLALEQLLELAEEYSEYTLLLVAAEEQDRDFVRRHSDALESRYVLSDPDTFLGKFTILER